MYSIVIQPSYEIGSEILVVNEYKGEIILNGTSNETEIKELLEMIKRTIIYLENKKDK